MFNTMEKQNTLNLFVLILFFSTCVFLAMLERDLWEPDEGRYADISRNFLVNNSWTVPYVNGVPHLDKPPLVMWMTAGGLELFGEKNWVFRWVSWIAGLMLLVVIGFLSRQSGMKSLTMFSIAVCGTSLLWFVFSQILNLDMAIASWVSLSLCVYWISFTTKKKKHRWMAISVMWVCIALGFLSKGLIAIVIPFGVIVLFALMLKCMRPVKVFLNPLGIGLSILVVLPWLLKMEHSIPGFNDYFLIHEHFLRFLTSKHKREGPVTYFFVVLTMGTLPWSFAVFDKKFWRKSYQLLKKSSLFKFLAAWGIFTFIFFSISKSKLPGYILPVMVPVCIFLGNYWSVEIKPVVAKWILKSWIAVFLLAGIISQFLTVNPPYLHLNQNYPTFLLSVFILISLIFVFMIEINTFTLKRSVILLTMIMGIALASLGHGAANLDSYKGTQLLADTIENLAIPESAVIVYGGFPRTLPVNLKQPIKIIGTHGEHLFPEAGTMDNEKIILTRAEGVTLFQKQPSFLILIEKHWKNDLKIFSDKNLMLVDYGNFGKWHLITNFSNDDA